MVEDVPIHDVGQLLERVLGCWFGAGRNAFQVTHATFVWNTSGVEIRLLVSKCVTSNCKTVPCLLRSKWDVAIGFTSTLMPGKPPTKAAPMPMCAYSVLDSQVRGGLNTAKYKEGRHKARMPNKTHRQAAPYNEDSAVEVARSTDGVAKNTRIHGVSTGLRSQPSLGHQLGGLSQTFVAIL